MAGEVERYAPTAIVPSIDLQQWAKDAEVVAGVAVNLAKTSFVPKSYEGKALETTAAILTGVEIGLKPMAALRSIDIIDGVPGMRAILLRALVQSHGHEIWTDETTATRAIVKGRRRGSENVETSTWTMDRATQQGLFGKSNWKRMPQSMLLARATSECARLIDADGLLGHPVFDGGARGSEGGSGGAAATPAAVPEKKAPARTAKRQALPKPEEPGSAEPRRKTRNRSRRSRRRSRRRRSGAGGEGDAGRAGAGSR
jgi:hypothetical protein